MIKKISQSFMKSMRDYLNGVECGHITKAKWVDGKLIDITSEEMELGSYFEYIFTLAMIGIPTLPKSGKIPMPKTQKSNPSKYLAAYELAQKNCSRLMTYFEKMGWEIIGANKTVTKGRFVGTIDLIVRCTKRIEFDNGIIWEIDDVLVIDLKYSGLLEDRWNRNGWKWVDIQKEYHGVQARQYHMLTDHKFYFLVVSSKNENDIKLFHVDVKPSDIEQHIEEGNRLMEQLKDENMMGFLARPDIATCSECPLAGGCKDKHEFPHPIIIDLI